MAAKAKKEAMDREIELVKKEYEGKVKKKKTTSEAKNKSEKGKESDKAKAEEMESEDEAAKAEGEQNEKVCAAYGIHRLRVKFMTILQIKAITSNQSPPVMDGIPRIYALQKYVFQISQHQV